MTEQSPKVGADLLVIPDGSSANTLSIGIQVTPTLKVAGDISLDRWPAEIARLAESVRIRLGTISGDQVTEVGSVVARSGLAGFFDPANEWRGKPRRDAASAMWQDIFQPVGFQSLIDAIGEMGTEKHFATLKFASTRTADLQLFLDALLAWHETQMPNGRASLTPQLKGFAGRMATWMTVGPYPHAPRQQRRSPRDPMRDRSDQLELLTQGFELLLQQDADRSDNALKFVTTFEAEVGTMFRDHWTRLFGANAPPRLEDEPDTSGWGAGTIEAASRKLSALLALPTLSHYLGLGVQVEISRESLLGLSSGAICAEFVAADGTRIGGETAWTAFEVVDAHFGPAPDPSAPSSADAFSRGLLNLGAQIDGRKPRFAMRSDDVVNTLHDLVQAVRNKDDPILKQYRRGLVLYDFANLERLREDEERARRGASRINYLNDLLAGFRPDFALATRGASNLRIAKERWRPVTFRSIECTHDELDPAFYRDPLIIRLKSRDHGYTTALVEEKDGALSREDEMFTWSGESLAVHAKRGNYPAPDPERDLALHLTYALPVPSTALGMPPLRENVGYGCGCRLVYVNGGGRDFDAATAIYAAETTFIIGNAAGRPYIFPPAPLPPPDIHLGWEDRLVRANDLEREVRGESSETLVIRDGAGSVRRFVTPPRGTFDSAEQQRQLDDPGLKDDSPSGALSGSKGIWLFGADGKLPEARFGARFGGIRYLDGEVLKHVPLDGRRRDDIEIGSDVYKAIKYRQSRGTVAILGRRRAPAAPDAPFYPDSNGARLKASLHRASLEGATTSPLSTDRDFWKAPQRPADAVPIVVDVLPSPDSASLEPPREITISDIDNRPVNLPYLQVLVPKGETYRLRLKGDSRRGDEAEAALTIVHAVEKPLLAPDFRPKEAPDDICSTNGIGLRAVTVTVRNDDTGAAHVAGLERWADKVRRYEASGLDMRCWPSEEGGTTTFFTGRVDLDRKSTSILRCEAIWEEFNEGTVSRTADGGWIRNIACETAQLFKFEVERRGSEGRADLLRVAPPRNPVSAAAEMHAAVTGVPGELRAISHAFRDGRARELKVKMVATSAFTAYYPDDAGAPSPGEWISRYDVESSRFSTASTIWTDCTFRPPPPQIDHVLPLFAWDKLPDQPESCRRVAHLRIYLGEGWYASGEGEQLGVVLLGDDDPETVCDYQTGRLEAFHRFITQAGSDPVRETSPVPLRIEPRHFRNAPAPVQAMLYLANGHGPSGGNERNSDFISPLPVSVLLFSPHFTENDGLFCDLEFDLGDSYFPFLRLGLVRYQEHAVDHLRLSYPIAFDVQLLPERRVWVEFDPNGVGERTVVVEGPGFEVPNLGQPSHKPNVLRLSILTWNWPTQEWRETSVIEEQLNPIVDQASYGYKWTKDFRLPIVERPQRFLLRAEEYENVPLDEPTGQYEDGEAVFRVVDGKRLVFSCMLPLYYPRSS
ncbi:hypothetical protein [Rhizobium johnstonii]|uniref:hypothetical protein n=1 Tax=Rhizobium johnstonii TaxID=3019933 RepID=UPI003F9C78C2